MAPKRSIYRKHAEFNILPDIVWDYFMGQGTPVPDRGNLRSSGLAGQAKDVDSLVWYNKQSLDRYVEANTNLRFSHYDKSKLDSKLYKAIAGEISILRNGGYIIDWGDRDSRHGVWRLTGKHEIHTPENAITEMEQGNFYATLAESTLYVQTKQEILGEMLQSQYEKCLFCGFPLEGYMVATHIIPYGEMRSYRPEDSMSPANGLLLCKLCDTAFEAGSIMLEPDYRVTVGSGLQDSPSRQVRSWIGDIVPSIEVGDAKYRPSAEYIKRKKRLVLQDRQG